jgi:SAM-dependent methyltransferase
MNWYLKVFTHNIISLLPKKEVINYFFQKKISKSLPLTSEQIVTDKALCTSFHFNNFQEFSNSTDNTNFFEFGAGYDLVIPLLFSSLGIQNQSVFDIRVNIRFELIRDAISKINNEVSNLSKIYSLNFSPLIPVVMNLTDLSNAYRINYLAPADARNTNLKNDSIDFCSNTATLEHIPPDDIYKIFIELKRILKPKGIISCIIDLNDHYSYFDYSITHYNYLKYNKFLWKLYNPFLHYQNRLRYPEYINIIKSTGFRIIKEYLTGPSENDISLLNKIKINNDFTSKYSLNELGVRSVHIVLRK